MQINLTPDPSLLAIVVIFLLNYLVVRRFFLHPINEIIEARETEAKTAEQLYEAALARFNEATTAMEAQLHGARRDAAQVRDRHRADAAARRGQIVERTQGEARQVIAEAETKLDQDVNEAREKIKRESENLARLAAERILGRAV
jgi:F-type H+-transporting ATPase subunit b